MDLFQYNLVVLQMLHCSQPLMLLQQASAAEAASKGDGGKTAPLGTARLRAAAGGDAPDAKAAVVPSKRKQEAPALDTDTGRSIAVGLCCSCGADVHVDWGSRTLLRVRVTSTNYMFHVGSAQRAQHGGCRKQQNGSQASGCSKARAGGRPDRRRRSSCSC